MPICRACSRLTEKPTKMKPHPALVSSGVKAHPDGTLEQFQCAKCGTRWERIVPRPYYRVKPLFWKIV
jgi:hypothetical protein